MLQEDKTHHACKHTSVICLTRYNQVRNLSDTQPSELCKEPIMGAGKREVYATTKFIKTAAGLERPKEHYHQKTTEIFR